MKNTFELEHVGINTDNAGEAEQLALLLCKLFNLEPRHGQKSEFAGNYFRISFTFTIMPASKVFPSS